MMLFGSATEDHKLYRLMDLEDGYGVVGYYDTLEQMQEAADEWEGDTDVDCLLIMQEWDEDMQGYVQLRGEDGDE